MISMSILSDIRTSPPVSDSLSDRGRRDRGAGVGDTGVGCHCQNNTSSLWPRSSEYKSMDFGKKVCILQNHCAICFGTVLHRYWTDFNNFWSFLKLRPSSRRYVDLDGLLVYFDPPPDTISTITNTTITSAWFSHGVCYGRYGIGRWVKMHQKTL